MTKKRVIIISLFAFALIAAGYIYYSTSAEDDGINFFRHVRTQAESDYDLNNVDELPWPQPVPLSNYDFSYIDMPEEFGRIWDIIINGNMAYCLVSIGTVSYIKLFNLETKEVILKGTNSTGDEIFYARAISFNNGILYAFNSNNHNIARFDAEGNYIDTFKISNLADFVGGAKNLTRDDRVMVSEMHVIDNGDIYLGMSTTPSSLAEISGKIFLVRNEKVISAEGNLSFGVFCDTESQDRVVFTNTNFALKDGYSTNGGLPALHLIESGKLIELKQLPRIAYKQMEYYDGHYYLISGNYFKRDLHVYDKSFTYIGEYNLGGLISEEDEKTFGQSGFSFDSDGNIYMPLGEKILFGKRIGD